MGIEDHKSYLDEFNHLDVAGYAALHPALFAYVKDAMAQPGKQFLLVGDTNHDSPELKKFLGGAPLAALFRNAAIPHVAVEIRREMIEQKYLDSFFYHYPQYLSGKFTQEQMEHGRAWLYNRGDEKAVNMKKTLLGFMQAGLRMTPADSRQWHDEGARDRNAERLFLGDREVSHYIARRAYGQKTGIVYGAGHFCYTDTMGSRFGRDKCVHIDMYSDRDAYYNLGENRRLHADLIPDKVYILDEKSLEDPDMTIYRGVRIEDDKMQQGRSEVAHLYGSEPRTLSQMTAVSDNLVPQPGFDSKWFTYVPDVQP